MSEIKCKKCEVKIILPGGRVSKEDLNLNCPACGKKLPLFIDEKGHITKEEVKKRRKR